MMVTALVLAALLAVTGAIYLISAYEEPIEAANETAAEGQPPGPLDLGTQVQTLFFAIAGLANLGVAGWIIVCRKNLTTRMPFLIAAIGSAALIGLYILSRTTSLPIVGIQDDVGTMDIVSKGLQTSAVGIALYMLSMSPRVSGDLKNKIA